MKDRCTECGKYWVLGYETCPTCGERTEKWFKTEHPAMHQGGESFGIDDSRERSREQRAIPVTDDAQSDYIADLLKRIQEEKGLSVEPERAAPTEVPVVAPEEDDNGIGALLAAVRAEREREEAAERAEKERLRLLEESRAFEAEEQPAEEPALDAASLLFGGPAEMPAVSERDDNIELSTGGSISFFSLFQAGDEEEAQPAATYYPDEAVQAEAPVMGVEGSVVMPEEENDEDELTALYERLKRKMGS